jgi:hypothetical protein
MKKSDLWIYRIATALLTLLMTFSATMYFVQNEMVRETFLRLGFPTFIIYPLAIAKILGLVAIWSNKFKMLKEWAYAGFFFDLLLAAGAHNNAGDGGEILAMGGLVLVAVSYFYNRKLDNISA